MSKNDSPSKWQEIARELMTEQNIERSIELARQLDREMEKAFTHRTPSSKLKQEAAA